MAQPAAGPGPGIDDRGKAVYAIVWTLVFVESGLLFGFFLPGDTVLFAAGLVAAEPGAGSGGRGSCAKAGRAAHHLQKAERFYERYGWFAVVLCRFVPWVRTFTPIVAAWRA